MVAALQLPLLDIMSKNNLKDAKSSHHNLKFSFIPQINSFLKEKGIVIFVFWR